MNIIDRIPVMLNKYPSQVRTAAIAIVPALLVFIGMEVTRPAPPLPAPPVEKPSDDILQHVLGKADFDAVSQLLATSGKTLQNLDRMIAGPADAGEGACAGGLRNGVASYMDTVLIRLRQDIATSASMKNAQDEKYLNGNISAGISSLFKVMPVLHQNARRIASDCPSDAAITAQANQIKTLLDQVAVVISGLQKRIPNP